MGCGGASVHWQVALHAFRPLALFKNKRVRERERHGHRHRHRHRRRHRHTHTHIHTHTHTHIHTHNNTHTPTHTHTHTYRRLTRCTQRAISSGFSEPSKRSPRIVSYSLLSLFASASIRKWLGSRGMFAIHQSCEKTRHELLTFC